MLTELRRQRELLYVLFDVASSLGNLKDMDEGLFNKIIGDIVLEKTEKEINELEGKVEALEREIINSMKEE